MEYLNGIVHESLLVDKSCTVWRPVITTDCGANIAAAIDNAATGAFWMKCVLHIIHNSMMAGFT